MNSRILCYYSAMNQLSIHLKFKDALRRALLNYENPNGKKGKQVTQGDALRHIAMSLIHLAINGERGDKMPAIKELIDRLDGKPVQAVTGIDGEPITVVQRVIIHQATDDAPALTHTVEQNSKLIN